MTPSPKKPKPAANRGTANQKDTTAPFPKFPNPGYRAEAWRCWSSMPESLEMQKVYSNIEWSSSPLKWGKPWAVSAGSPPKYIDFESSLVVSSTPD
jgi:hypothetical protein